MPSHFISLFLAALSLDAHGPEPVTHGIAAMKHGGVSAYTLGRGVPRSVSRSYTRAARAGLREQYREAIQFLEKGLRRDPGNKEALNDLGVFHQAIGDHAEALACFDSALAADPGYALAQRNKAYLLAALRRPIGTEQLARSGER